VPNPTSKNDGDDPSLEIEQLAKVVQLSRPQNVRQMSIPYWHFSSVLKRLETKLRCRVIDDLLFAPGCK
jgi:hypothetical protein